MIWEDSKAGLRIRKVADYSAANTLSEMHVTQSGLLAKGTESMERPLQATDYPRRREGPSKITLQNYPFMAREIESNRRSAIDYVPFVHPSRISDRGNHPDLALSPAAGN
jgi:hypothetical protein